MNDVAEKETPVVKVEPAKAAPAPAAIAPKAESMSPPVPKESALERTLKSSVAAKDEDVSTHVNLAVPTPGLIKKGKARDFEGKDLIPSNWVIQTHGNGIIARSVTNNVFEGSRTEFNKKLRG